MSYVGSYVSLMMVKPLHGLQGQCCSSFNVHKQQDLVLYPLLRSGIIQAAMEAALPIAQIDAGNKQQMALLKKAW